MTASHEIPKEGVCSFCGGRYVLPEHLRRQIPNRFEQRAAELGCRIDVMFGGEMEEGIDYGPYHLCDAEDGAHVWGTGLPLEGIADALDCLEREQTEGYGAWADFGSSWLKTTRPRHG